MISDLRFTISDLRDELIPTLDAFVEASRRLERKKSVKVLMDALERAMQKAFRALGKLVLEKLAGYRERFDLTPNPSPAEAREGMRSQASAGRIAMRPYDLVETISPREWAIIFGEASEETLELFSGPLLQQVRAALKAGGNQTIASFGMSDLFFGLANPGAIRYLDEVGGLRIRNITETTRSEIQTLLSQASREGWSYDKLAGAVKGRFEEFAVGQPQAHIASRAHLVAVTEIGDAYEQAGFLATGDLQAGGLQMEKAWRTAGDDRVSDGCRQNEAQGWIPYDAAHASGHVHPLRFPGCRCDEQYRRKE